ARAPVHGRSGRAGQTAPQRKGRRHYCPLLLLLRAPKEGRSPRSLAAARSPAAPLVSSLRVTATAAAAKGANQRPSFSISASCLRPPLRRFPPRHARCTTVILLDKCPSGCLGVRGKEE
ncbi:unnamed protein product, partial [Ectocarpus sp. 12 AP-2014]